MYCITEQLYTTKQKSDYKEFLEKGGLQYEESDIQLCVYDGNKIIGGVSLHKNCIKLLRVSCKYANQGISNTLISDIVKMAYDKGIFNLFVYTNPENEEKFNNQGFYTLYKTDNVLFLENERNGIKKYINSLQRLKREGEKICGLVMNLNPLTKGHEYLIKTASYENDWVHIIIVKEDNSIFPYEVRLNLLKSACKKYNNVIVHSGSDYVISNATFPSYFIKSKDEVPSIYATLDANIFGHYVAKALGINRRYVGTEPYSKTTNLYNNILKQQLPKYNIEVVEIERCKVSGEIISASKVREFIKEEKLEKAFSLLPEETVQFLKTERGQQIIEKVKTNNNRH